MLQEQTADQPGQTSLTVLRARWLNAKAEQPKLALMAHQAVRAIDHEQLAQETHNRIDPTDAFDAFKYCDALDHYSRALEAWAFVSARLWLEAEKNPALSDLHQCSLDQFARLTARQEAMQQQAFTFCTTHHVLLRFHVVTQAFDISSGAEVTA